MGRKAMTNVTPEPRVVFLEALAETANITVSANKAAVSRETVYRWRRENDDFAKAWRDALSIGVEALEDAAMQRAKDGLMRYVTSAGRVVMHPVTGEPLVEMGYSDQLTMFLLKAHKPDLYKDRSAVETTGSVSITISSVDADL